MMDSSETESVTCRCCLNSDLLHCMTEEDVENKKSYVDMLNHCFNIDMTEMSAWICEVCIPKLSDAYTFHCQVCTVQDYFNPPFETIPIFKTEVEVKEDPGTKEEYEEQTNSDDDNNDNADTDMDMDVDDLPLSSHQKFPKDEFSNDIAREKSLKVLNKSKQSSDSKTQKTLLANNLIINEMKEEKNCVVRIDVGTLNLSNFVKNKSIIDKRDNLKGKKVALKVKKSIKLTKPSEKNRNLSNVFKSMPLDINIHSLKTNEDIVSEPILLQHQKNTSIKNSNALPNIPRSTISLPNVSDELESLKRDCIDYYFFTRPPSQYRCGVCQESYADVDDFKVHVRQHSSEETEKLLSKRNIWSFKIDISSMKCRHCKETATDLDTFRSHLSAAHNIQPKDLFSRLTPFNLIKGEIKCAICTKVYVNMMSLTKHMNEHSTNCICPHCGKSFVSNNTLRNHIRQKHTSGTFKCSKCDEIFETVAKREYHAMKKHRTQNYFCQHCPEILRSHHAKIVHSAKVHNEELKKYKCSKCPKKFVTSGSLSVHNREIHLQVRNHACTECEKMFYHKNNLIDHMVKHTGAKKYGCEVCGKSYGRASTLKEHMRIHNNDRKHICSICGLGFVQKCVLASHLRVHFKDKGNK